MKAEIITICVSFVIIAVFYLVAHFTRKQNEKLKSDNKALEEKLAKAQSEIAFLIKHIEEVQKIKNDESLIRNKIEGAKTDEEVADIVSVIIAANNDRVSDNTKK